jgi:hypothetical protein
MTRMAAVEVGYPVTRFVLMEGNDGAPHQR